MDRLGFFKQGLSSIMEAAQTTIGLKKAAESFADAVDDALKDIAPEIGLYLPSLDAAMYDSPSGTLYEVGQMGYKMVEVGCYYDGTVYGTKPAELRDLARSSGLKITGLHLNKFYETTADKLADASVGIDADASVADMILSEECRKWWAKALATAKEMGCRYVVMSRLPEQATKQTAIEYAHYFEQIGAMAEEQGLRFCFHPLRGALLQHEGESLFDVIAQNSDKERLFFEIDTYETVQAGIDVGEIIKQYGKRLLSLHLHDYGILCDSGQIDFNAIIGQASKCGIHDLFVEVSSFSLPPQNCVEHSLQNIEMLNSIHY